MMATSYRVIRPAVGFVSAGEGRNIRAMLNSVTDPNVADAPDDEEAAA